MSAGGPVRFAGRISETGSVQVAGSPAIMSAGSNFLSYANLAAGTNTVQITAKDLAANASTTNYQVVVTNSGVAETLTYDLNGNEISAITDYSTNTYDWDAADRLTKITQILTNAPLRTSEFSYDGLGRRVQIVEKQNSSLVLSSKFLWCGTELCEERDSTGASVTKRFFGEGEQISGTSYFFARDHLGSVREMTDSSSALRARYDYDPYGKRTKVSGDLDADFGFTGHYVHSVSGLYLALFRAYDSRLARWLSRDPLEDRAGLNLYEYVANDPVMLLDPLGLSFSGAAKSFGISFGGSLVGSVAVAVLVGVAATATSPLIAAAAAVTAVAAVGYGTYQLGIGIRRAVDGVDPYTGRPLTTDELDDAAGSVLGGLAGGAVWGIGYTTGGKAFIRPTGEITIGPKCKNAPRIAPFGNRTGNRYGEFPHYHRQIVDPNGKTVPGGSINNHRPYENGF